MKAEDYDVPIEGTRVRAVGVALADGITLCILWATLVEGDPS